jgi:hypothetical protein
MFSSHMQVLVVKKFFNEYQSDIHQKPLKKGRKRRGRGYKRVI